jgi:hypothetical protein
MEFTAQERAAIAAALADYIARLERWNAGDVAAKSGSGRARLAVRAPELSAALAAHAKVSRVAE